MNEWSAHPPTYLYSPAPHSDHLLLLYPTKPPTHPPTSPLYTGACSPQRTSAPVNARRKNGTTTGSLPLSTPTSPAPFVGTFLSPPLIPTHPPTILRTKEAHSTHLSLPLQHPPTHPNKQTKTQLRRRGCSSSPRRCHWRHSSSRLSHRTNHPPTHPPTHPLRYADVVVHRLLAAAIGVAPLPDSLMDKGNLHDLSENMNRRHKAAQNAGRGSTAFHTVLFFKENPAGK